MIGEIFHALVHNKGLPIISSGGCMLTKLQSQFFNKPYRVMSLLCLLIITQGFFHARPDEIARGLRAIILAPAVLVSDYIAIGGIGATLVNVGLAGLLALLAMYIAQHEPSGLTFGTIGLVLGFAFFGKNPLNMLPIMLGGYLGSKFVRAPYKDFVLKSILATCLAPVVTQLAFAGSFAAGWGVALGVGIGIFIGFIMYPLAAAMRKTHNDLNLYNVGLAAGLGGVGLFALFRLLGVDYALMGIWSEGYDVHLAVLLAIVSVYLIACGYWAAGPKISLLAIIRMEADDNDFFVYYKERSYVAMGLLGLASLALMWALGGEYSGPVIGAILSVVGFGAFGKSLPNAATLMAGALLAALSHMAITGVPFNNRGFLVAAFFATCLSPLARAFGIKWGLIAGFLHLALANQVAIFHGGMNLYNNGFAGGLAVMVLLPIIRFFRERI